METTEEDEVIPLTVPVKGELVFTVTTNGSSDVIIYADKECTEKISDYMYVSNYSEPTANGKAYFKTSQAYISQKGTVYVKFSDPGIFKFSSYVINGSNRTLKNDTTVLAYGSSRNDYNYDSQNLYFKLKAPENGYITVISKFLENNYGSNNITLCNSEKKALTEETYGNKAVFAVKEGKTYYIKCNTYYGVYKIKYKFKAVNEKSGTSETKAQKLTLGKEVKGLIFAEDKVNRHDYYKFVLPKATKVKMKVTGNAFGEALYVKLYSKNLYGSLDFNMYDPDYSYETDVTTTTSEYLPKGTYYIVVEKKDQKGSGNYSIKVSKR